MLLSFRSRLRVTLGAEHVQVDVERGGRQSAMASKVLTVKRQDAAISWEPSLAAWRAHVDEAGIAGKRVDVVVADCFARYALVPWPEQNLGRDELEAFVRIQFENLYGEAVRAWTCRYDMRRFGEAGIACAIDTALVDAIELLCTESRCTLTSLRPQFMQAFNAAPMSAGSSALFAVSAEGSCTLGVRDDHGWRSIRSVRCRRTQLRQVLERERLLQGLPDDAPIYVAGLPGSSVADVQGIVACTVLDEGVRADAVTHAQAAA